MQINSIINSLTQFTSLITTTIHGFFIDEYSFISKPFHNTKPQTQKSVPKKDATSTEPLYNFLQLKNGSIIEYDPDIGIPHTLYEQRRQFYIAKEGALLFGKKSNNEKGEK